MHILKIIHGYPPLYNAGSEVYSQSLCEELSKTNRVTVFTREENPYQKEYSIRKSIENENLTLYRINYAQSKERFCNEEIDIIFENLLKDLKPDIAHIGHLNHLSTGIVDVLYRNKIPIIFTLHDFWLMCPRGQFLQRDGEWSLCSGQENLKCATKCYSNYFTGSKVESNPDISYWTNWVSHRMEETRSFVQKVDLFIAPSRYLENKFLSEFSIPKNKIQYLDYGFPDFSCKPKISSNQKYRFGYIGTHLPAKGINLLIEAFMNLDIDAELKIYGAELKNNSKYLKDLAKNSKNSIQFLGEYENKSLDKIFEEVDCIIVPSIWEENSPLVIHEAQIAKIPVITSNLGGMKEYVEHGVNGLLFESRNIKSLGEQLVFAEQNRSKLLVFGKRGYLYSEDGKVVSIETHANILLELYKHLETKKNFFRITLDTNPEDCNAKCIMCEEHSEHSDYIDRLELKTGTRKRRMPIDALEKIFKEAKDLGVKEIIPSTMGEPLLYSGIEKIYSLAKEYSLSMNLTTNGSFPKKTTKQWAELIIPNTSDIKISWNGSTKQTYESIMKGLNFEKNLQNVKDLIRLRNEYYTEKGKYCRISFQLTFLKSNMHELGKIVQLAIDLGVDRVKGHHLWAHFAEIKDLSMKSSKDSILLWNQYVKEANEIAESHRLPNGKRILLENIVPLNDSILEIPESYDCPFLGKEIWISATGDYSPCCAPDDSRKTLGDFGNISNSSIKEVLQSETYIELQKNYKSKSVCKSCNMRKAKL